MEADKTILDMEYEELRDYIESKVDFSRLQYTGQYNDVSKKTADEIHAGIAKLFPKEVRAKIYVSLQCMRDEADIALYWCVGGPFGDFYYRCYGLGKIIVDRHKASHQGQPGVQAISFYGKKNPRFYGKKNPRKTLRACIDHYIKRDEARKLKIDKVLDDASKLLTLMKESGMASNASEAYTVLVNTASVFKELAPGSKFKNGIKPNKYEIAEYRPDAKSIFDF